MKTRYLGAVLLTAFLSNPIAGWSQPVSRDVLQKTLLSGKWEEIDRAAETLMPNRDWRNQASVLRGYAAMVSGNFAAAVGHLRRANLGKVSPASAAWLQALAASHPDNAMVQFLAADALERSGDMKGAAARFDTALKLQPEFYLARLARATSRTVLGARDSALEDLNQLTATPVAADALLLRGLMRVEQSDFVEAAKDLHRAVELAPNHAVAWNALGILHARQNKWPEAARAFETAFKYSPDLVEAKANYQLALGAGELGTVLTEQKRLTVFVTDFGIENWSPKLKMFDDFKNAKTGSVVPNLPRQGQILIPMPADKDLPRNSVERDRLKQEIAKGVIARIEMGKLATYEIRIAQNISVPGYFDPSRQAAVKDFGRTAYEAFGVVKSHFEGKGTNINMPAIVGSNGAYVLTETLPKLKINPIDSAVLIDGRAYVGPTKETYKVLGGRLTGINTSGDAPALPGMIANHAGMNELKKEQPNMRVFWADPKGADVFFKNHLASMHPDKALSVKEFNGQNYTTPTKMTGWELMGRSLNLHLPSLEKSVSQPLSVKPTNSPGGISFGPVNMVMGEGGKIVFKAGGGGTLKVVYTLYRSSPEEPKNVPSPTITRIITTNR